MLLRLEINQFALIDHLEIDFTEGFTVLTGETGAGKSILIDAISAVLGNRITKEIVRYGSDMAEITGVFEYDENENINEILNENSINNEENILIINRQISSSGKTFAKVNGKMILLSALKDLTDNLLDIHGQHENQSIFKTEKQLELLDKYAGLPVVGLLNEYKIQLSEFKICNNKLKEYIEDDDKKDQIIDLLNFQINEIKTIHPKLDEDKVLTQRRQIISNSVKIKSTLDQSYNYLNGESGVPALAAISQAKNLILQNLSGYDEYTQISDKLSDIEYSLEDICDNIIVSMDKIDVYPNETDEIDERLDLLFNLKRKYGGSIEEVLNHYKKATEKLKNINQSEEMLKSLKIEKNEIVSKINKAAKFLHDERVKAAKNLQDKITKELNDLGMKNTKFHIDVNYEDKFDNFPLSGLDSVEFLISPNLGEELKSLSKIASGGEASRIMLAIKTILAENDNIQSLIFDEIDTGISGKVAGLLGDKLNKLSTNRQVFCVTHMASIAAKAKNHYFIEKKEVEDHTLTFVKRIKNVERINEIARLLSGEENKEKANDLAKEMLLASNNLN